MNSFLIPAGYWRFKLLILLVMGLALPVLAEDWNDQAGLQLESLKSKTGHDLSGALKETHDFGFKYVELVGDYNMSADALKTKLQEHQLTAISAHFPYARFRDDPEGVANEASQLGLKFVGCPSLPQKEKLDLAGCQAVIAVFNRAGEILTKHNIQFFYHPHGYEFKPYADGTFFDLMVSQTNPKFVHYQMDVFWIVHAGQDPLKLFKKYGDRWVSMHLKGMKQDARTGFFDSHVDRSAFVPVSEGQIDIAAVIQAAHAVGIKWFFIEDESATPDTGIPKSVQYLQKLSW
jgi:sugar phosphate isomerase/epimerase